MSKYVKYALGCLAAEGVFAIFFFACRCYREMRMNEYRSVWQDQAALDRYFASGQMIETVGYLLLIPSIVLSVALVGVILGFLVLALVKHFKPEVSSYPIWTWTVVIFHAVLICWGINNTLTDSSFLPGVAGFLVIIISIPGLILSLITELIVRLVRRTRKNKPAAELSSRQNLQ